MTNADTDAIIVDVELRIRRGGVDTSNITERCKWRQLCRIRSGIAGLSVCLRNNFSRCQEFK